ncbi:MAG: flagellar hook-associated protein FlgK [Sedimentisphaerales bacterium]|nr:flagellar hook-associated protein FlgK [Sedimentisphaerales bacterium]
MSLINGSLQIGQTGLSASQAGLSVTGNNISNSATPGYSRQVANLVPTQYYEVFPGKYTGTGVTVSSINRLVDESLNSRYRNASGDVASFQLQQQTMSRLEAAFNELTDDDISSRLNSFFAAWSSLQIQPQDVASRNVVLQNADTMTSVIRELRTDLKDVHDDLNSQIKASVIEADTLAKQIAALNSDIVSTEAGKSGSASALRDQRDSLLKELNSLINISTRENEGGSVTVYIGSEPLIQYTDCRGLTIRDVAGNNGEKITEIIFDDNDGQLELTTGRLNGMLIARDEMVDGVISELDNWSSAMIYEVNKLHSIGSSMEKVQEMVSDYKVIDSSEPLTAAAGNGLNWGVTNGVINVHIFDSSGEIITTEQVKIDVNAPGSDSLDSVAAKLDAIDGLTSFVDGGGYLHIESSSAGDSFAFSAVKDAEGMVDFDATSNILAVLGINTFFSGNNASDIRLKAELYNHPERVVAGNFAIGLTTDGSIASQIAALATKGVQSLGGISLANDFSSLVADIASNTKRSEDNYSASAAVRDTLLLEVQSISGVSIDEETMNLITFQRAYQGAAKYIGVVDELLDELMMLIN